MAWFANVGASLPRPEKPAITFMSIDRVLSLALLLLKASRGGADSYEQLHSFVYSCLIYDQYATEWKQQHKTSTWSQLQSWVELAGMSCLIEADRASLPRNYHGRIVGDVKLALPVPSLEPDRAAKGISAPKRLQGTTPAEYESKALGLAEFIEVAYMVRCNLLHGAYDIREDAHAAIILNTGLRFTDLLRWIVQNTTW
jgi:hypothetical protein